MTYRRLEAGTENDTERNPKYSVLCVRALKKWLLIINLNYDQAEQQPRPDDITISLDRH